MISRSSDKTIKVSDIVNQQHEATLDAHTCWTLTPLTWTRSYHHTLRLGHSVDSLMIVRRGVGQTREPQCGGVGQGRAGEGIGHEQGGQCVEQPARLGESQR